MENTQADNGRTGLFSRKFLLSPTFVPELDRIVERREELAYLADAINPIVFSQVPNDVVLRGPSGSGKSLCAKFVARRNVQNAREHGVKATTIRIDCAVADTETRSLQAIGRRLNHSGLSIRIPNRGLSTERYRSRVRHVLDADYDVVILVLQNVHHLVDAALTTLTTRFKESLETCDLGVVGITTTMEDSRTIPWDESFTLDTYTRETIEKILHKRSDAFEDGALGDRVITHVAKMASEPEPNARRAIHLLRAAGEIAENDGTQSVSESHVKQAEVNVNRESVGKHIQRLSDHARLTLRAMVTLTSDEQSTDGPKTKTVYNEYQDVCASHDCSPLSERRIRDLLSELATVGLTTEIRHKGGQGKGNFMTHIPAYKPTMIETVLDDGIWREN